ncbi:MAG TPA: DUF3035 domain-containing protein [Rhizomicrobium sp.]|jgi:type IV secretory pathway VirB10-like protein
MSSNAYLRFVLNGVAIASLGLALSACQDVREAAGLNKQAPDEFAVVSKAPLIIPPDFNLKPPKPGAAPLNQTSPTVSAEAALYSNDPAAVAKSMPGNYSDSEKMLLAQAGAANASDGIRQQITADNDKLQSADDSFTDTLLFGGPTDTADAPVNADAEKARIDANKDSKPAETQASDAPQIKKDDSGWLDGIF